MLEDRKLPHWLKPTRWALSGTMKPRSLARALVVALCLTSLIGAAPARSEERPADGTLDAIVSKHPWIGQPAPEIDLLTTNGERVMLGDFKGEKLVVMHFAASW